MSDTHVEYSREGYFGRLGGAIKGVVTGVVLFALSFGVLFWNEGRAVKRARALDETAAGTVSVQAAAIDPANEGKPVHFSGAATGQKLADPTFGVARDAIHLHRVAEMYQWDEDEKRETTKDTVGGGKTTKTTYTYKKVWSESPIDSSKFRQANGHQNPPAMRVRGEKWAAKQVNVGAFRLPRSLVSRIDNFEPVPVNESMLNKLPPSLGRGAVASEGRFYLPYAVNPQVKVNPEQPQVGDIRVSFKAVPPGPVSVVAKQAGGTLEAFQTSNGPVELLYVGAHTVDAMFKSEHTKNNLLTWILRVAGFVVMWVGLATALNPLKVLADVVGILGDVVGAGVGLISGLVALTLSVSTIAVAWLVYRPLLGTALLAVAAAGVWWFTRLRKKGHARYAAGAGPAAPAPAAPLPPVPAAEPYALPPVPGKAASVGAAARQRASASASHCSASAT